MNIKHKIDDGYRKMDIQCVIRELELTIFLRISIHTISPITGHFVWNIKLFFIYFDLIKSIDSFFSLSCALLCCSSNYCVLGIAR